MGNVINTNTSAINSQNNLSRTNNALNTSSQNQASGFRINSARDDAAGLVIANQLNAEVVTANSGIRNANDGISIAQTADAALQEVTNVLQRGRELALAAASGQNSDEARAALNSEFQALGQEVARIASDTEFGGQSLFTGGNTFDIQSGSDAGNTIAVQTPDVTNIAAAFSSEDISTSDNASSALSVIDNQLASLDTARVDLGATQNRLSSPISNLQNSIENTSASESRIRDTDFAAQTSERARSILQQQVGVSVQAQANVTSEAALTLLSR
jgi:flagellin